MCPLLVWLLLLSPVGLASAACSLPNDTPDKRRLLDTLSLLHGKKFVVVKNYTYAVSICSDLYKGADLYPSVSRTYVPENATVILGRYNDTDIVGQGHWLLLKYSSGDNGTEGPCKGVPRSAQIMITCDNSIDEDPDGLQIELLDASFGGCTTVFHLRTSILCPPSGMSRASVFFLLWGTVGVLYCAFGVAYKRFVRGAKGWEQIPNYDFWSDPCQCFKELVLRRSGGRRDEAWDNLTNNFSDPADEPLLHP